MEHFVFGHETRGELRDGWCSLRASGRSLFPFARSGGNSRTGPNFRIMPPRTRNRATVWTRTFSAVRKSVACPLCLLTSAFPGFAPGRLAGTFRASVVIRTSQALKVPRRIVALWTFLSCRSRHGLVYKQKLASEGDPINDQIKFELGKQRATVRFIRSSWSFIGFFLTLLQGETIVQLLRRGAAVGWEVASICP